MASFASESSSRDGASQETALLDLVTHALSAAFRASSHTCHFEENLVHMVLAT